MNSQIFKKRVPSSMLWDLLGKVCVDQGKYFLLSPVSFKQAEYHNILSNFCASLDEYYHNSKKHYINRKLNYIRFTTLVRQICNINQISFTSKIVYNRSSYDILYYIYKPI
jgi:hypothetical protein